MIWIRDRLNIIIKIIIFIYWDCIIILEWIINLIGYMWEGVFSEKDKMPRLDFSSREKNFFLEILHRLLMTLRLEIFN
jgi:hypothetical protein